MAHEDHHAADAEQGTETPSKDAEKGPSEAKSEPTLDEDSVQNTDKTVEPDDSEQEAGHAAVGQPAPKRWRRTALPALIWLLCAVVYVTNLVTTLGDAAFQPSPDNHYAHLANSWLEGRLDQGGNPPGTNDWACYDTEAQDMCPNNRFRFADQERYKWYVSFPPFPAAVIMPAVAVLGVDMPDRIFWALIAALGPAMLFILLRRLEETGRSGRTRREDLWLTALFAVGTVFFFVAVQGTVWFAAQTVAVPLIAAYTFFALAARRPILAGAMLGLCFLTRPTTALLCIFFGLEALRVSRRPDADAIDPTLPWWRKAWRWLRDVQWGPAIRRGALFAAPILVCGAVAMWMNDARFDDPFEFGHSFLQIRWRDRIERWGLFNYHYFAKNLGVFATSMPWLSLHEPHIMFSRHGIALWVTTPAILLTLWPKKLNATIVALWAAVIPVAIWNLMYQNSGWAQFGYRFALDYLILVFALLALTRRRFGVGFAVLFIWSIAINAFGAFTFERAGQFYDGDPTQATIYQPD